MADDLVKAYNSVPKSTFKHPFSGKSRFVIGQHRFSAFLAEKRSEKRVLETKPVGIFADFDPAHFNFSKVCPEEIFAYFDGKKLLFPPKLGKSAHFLIINSIPCFIFHSLFVPSFARNLAQCLTLPTLFTALSFSAEICAGSPLRLGFNSLSAHASVNHLHFHCFAPGQKSALLPLERVPLKNPLLAFDGCALFSVSSAVCYPASFFAFEATGSTREGDLSEEERKDLLFAFAQHVFGAIAELQSSGVPHNLIVVPPKESNALAGLKVFVWPRKAAAEYKATEINLACLEFSGVFCVKNEKEFAALTEAYLSERLIAECVGSAEFEKLEKRICSALNEVE